MPEWTNIRTFLHRLLLLFYLPFDHWSSCVPWSYLIISPGYHEGLNQLCPHRQLVWQAPPCYIVVFVRNCSIFVGGCGFMYYSSDNNIPYPCYRCIYLRSLILSTYALYICYFLSQVFRKNTPILRSRTSRRACSEKICFHAHCRSFFSHWLFGFHHHFGHQER